MQILSTQITMRNLQQLDYTVHATIIKELLEINRFKNDNKITIDCEKTGEWYFDDKKESTKASSPLQITNTQ